ncbi:MAG: eukaryotic-like serine/threonine-protein kinase [Actinomycetota bacterium]|jgi:serine/threonine-protein kinase|nr:eukaryotic-like serine/threonine-protein kinase [Actinomycetota bacterium]
MAERVFGGRYAVIERVGVGGMAEVYRARDELLGREVAVKVLNERLSADKSFVERFRREAQAAANLAHPNIVSLYDYGNDDGAYFIVMEYIDGRGLEEVVKEGPLMPERAAEMAVDVARALERAHDAGLVHRDIKPSNIMITSYGQTKVTDFGIVRALGADAEQTMTQTGMVIGTAAYLSPEQAQGTPVDARTDIYALGCVLYEMLTGRPPFTGDTPLSIAYKHVRENPDPPSRLNPDVPSELDAIVMKALAKNPENRYSSARAMREDLERFLAGKEVHAGPVMAGTTVLDRGAGASGTQVISRQDEFYEDDSGGGRRAGLYVVIALLLLGLFAGLAYLLANNLLGGEQVRVPNVVGQDQDAARERLEDRGFDVNIERKASKKPSGIVVAQDPAGGDEADEGSTVVLTVSTGPKQVTVPGVEGLSLDDARSAIEDADLKVGDITHEPAEDVEEDIVLSQSPPADAEASAGTEVDLTVSGGPAPVTVPIVVGQDEDSAVAEIEGAGLVADTITTPSDEDAGTVIAQDPEGGSEAASGDTVTITVSEGPAEREMPNVTGQDGDEAQSILESDYGLSVTQVDEPCAASIPPGSVCRQDPEPGTPVSEGDSATLYIQPGDAGIGFGKGIFALSIGWLSALFV